MLKFRILIFILPFICFSQPKVELTGFESLKNKVMKTNDTLYVVNFWATWCKPCVKELPHFFEVEKKTKDQKVSFVFVSLDFPKNQEKVNSFLLTNNASGKHVLLIEKDPNIWVEKVEKSWEGNIPATWLVKNRQTLHFVADELSENELYQLIK
ncbi:MAG: TlpA disulfide reductase family protein [Cytophagales bacterium]